MRPGVIGAALAAAVAGLTATSVAPVGAAVPSAQTPARAARHAPAARHGAPMSRVLPTAAPATRYLVFVGATGTGQNYGLYRSVPGTTARTTLLAPGGPRGVTDPPAIDPTGKWIAYSFADATGTGVAITSISGLHTYVVVHRPATEPMVVAPTWSPDGKTLVVERYNDSTSVAVGLAMVRPVKGGILKPIKGTSGLTYPKFLPKSSTTLVARRPKDGATVVVTTAGKVTLVGKYGAVGFAVSPNAKLLAYTDARGNLWVRPWRAKGAARKLAHRGLVEFPVFSRNGATIFFDSPASGGLPTDIFSVNVAGKTLVREQVTPALEEWGPAVSA
jgi:hypothetical protein